MKVWIRRRNLGEMVRRVYDGLGVWVSFSVGDWLGLLIIGTKSSAQEIVNGINRFYVVIMNCWIDVNILN